MASRSRGQNHVPLNPPSAFFVDKQHLSWAKRHGNIALSTSFILDWQKNLRRISRQCCFNSLKIPRSRGWRTWLEWDARQINMINSSMVAVAKKFPIRTMLLTETFKDLELYPMRPAIPSWCSIKGLLNWFEFVCFVRCLPAHREVYCVGNLQIDCQKH